MRSLINNLVKLCALVLLCTWVFITLSMFKLV